MSSCPGEVDGLRPLLMPPEAYSSVRAFRNRDEYATETGETLVKIPGTVEER